jgi:ABC-type nitrate/sulfonate/bicarbonate transport system ATPase subunit
MGLSCEDLTVSFSDEKGGEVCAIKNLNLEARDREFVGVVGPSGCGKTTLLRALAGLIEPQHGAIRFDDHSDHTPRRNLLVFQEDGLFPWMTVLENAAFGLEVQGVRKADRDARATKLLQRFGLAGREDAYPRQLSVGMKQRVAVIRSFISEPSVLLMDEPFSALDAQTRLQLQQELLALWEQNHHNVIFVTHDVDEVILLSDRVLVMSPQPGHVIAEYPVPFPRRRTPEVLLEQPALDLKRQIFRKLGMRTKDVLYAS